MPDLIRASVSYCREQHHSPEAMLTLNFVMVGYSESAGRMMGHAFQRMAGSDDVQSARDFPQSLAPFWAREDLPSGIRADRQGMIALAKHQCRLARERGPSDFPAGGDFFIAEVRRNSISIQKAFEFPARQEKANGTTADD
ncbi:hypothetical protein D9M70_590790 [compost metagenome]